MAEEAVAQPEFPNFIGVILKMFPDARWNHYVHIWESLIFAVIVAVLVAVVTFMAVRKRAMVPGRLQCAVELLAGGLDGFLRAVMGESRGRKYVPFIGTLFVYIITMNLLGYVPFMKAATSDWSITIALALCVFVYVQFTAFKELGFIGYADHLAGTPRGFLAYSVVLPVLMFCIHIITELLKPLTLSLRLRSNVWGDEMLLALLAGFGVGGYPLMFFSTFITLIAAVIQAVVFSLLTSIYFALVMGHEEEPKEEKHGF
ncbi:MAG TPA: F0F1 ATP synthase subunit A [Candidatus Omnitrophota bacterium]|nr:F0F1 ATP synthase subunit A [Candidatus Omnitrophota bacterium]HPS20860.1 F0F1 ATP synthase subunit A [Candidatus Omnitrophota bacterium]